MSLFVLESSLALPTRLTCAEVQSRATGSRCDLVRFVALSRESARRSSALSACPIVSRVAVDARHNRDQAYYPFLIVA